jgi:hypothetical protein
MPTVLSFKLTAPAHAAIARATKHHPLLITLSATVTGGSTATQARRIT